MTNGGLATIGNLIIAGELIRQSEELDKMILRKKKRLR